MALYGTSILKNNKRTKTAKSLVVYSDTGLGKSTLFRNAPSCVFLNLENRLGHIEGTLAEDRITTLAEYRNSISKLGSEMKTIQKLKTAIEQKDTKTLDLAKKKLKDSYAEYYDVAIGKESYVKLVAIDSTDDLYGMVAKEVCEELGVPDLSVPDRNQGYGIAKTRFLSLIRETMNLNLPIVMFCGITKAKEAWNTEGKDIPFVGSGSAYKTLSRKVTGVFSIDVAGDGKRHLCTNPKNSSFFIKNSFDDHFTNKRLPEKIALDFEELNKWVEFYTPEEIAEWKKVTGLKKL